MADVNRLKYINDTFGHDKGDIYIIGCCRVMEDICSHSSVYRIGGDEFIIILEQEDHKNREKIFNDLRSAYEIMAFDESREPWMRFSASVGMAEYEAGSALDDVTKRADEAMYEAKAKFRKRYGSNR